MNLRFTFKCRYCGDGSGIVIPDNPADAPVITCAVCKAILASQAEFDDKIRDASSKAAAEYLQNVLNGREEEPPVIELEL